MSAIACVLVRGQLEGKRLAVSPDQLARLPQRRRRLLLALSCPAGEAELEQEQLVERKPLPAALRLLDRPGPVQGEERVGTRRERLACLQPGREEVQVVAREPERGGHERAHPRRCDLLAGGIDRRQVGGRAGTVQVVRANRELVPPQLAAEPHDGSGQQLLCEPVLVEPDRRDRAALVRDHRLQHGQPPARAAQRDVPHLADDHRLLLAEEVGDPALADCALVVARPVLQQVPDRAEAELAQARRDPLPDPGQRVEPQLQALGMCPATQARPRLGSVHAGKARRPRHLRPSIGTGPAPQ